MKKSQKDMVLDYLKHHVGMTSLTAYDKLGITRLSARISDLRGMGYEIQSVPKKVKNRFGDICNVAEYRLVK